MSYPVVALQQDTLLKTTLSPSVISRSDPGWVRAMEYSSGAMKPGVRQPDCFAAWFQIRPRMPVIPNRPVEMGATGFHEWTMMCVL
jgi:hypothetical protein